MRDSDSKWISSAITGLIHTNNCLLEALEMVADADDDARADGKSGMPLCARSKIDRAIAKAKGE